MHKLKLGFLPVLLLVLLAAVPARASVIVVTSSATSNPSNCGGIDYLASWSQSIGYTGVSISAVLASAPGSGDTAGLAYLMNQIGPGTDASNEVAAPQPIVLSAGTPAGWVSLFTGLDLEAGDYYLVIRNYGVGPDAGAPLVIWDQGGTSSSDVTTQLGTGVSQPAQPYQLACCLGYAPSGSYSPGGGKFVAGLFSVTGEAVPEPAVPALCMAALCAFVWLARRRRAA
jgi:uncharacterized protein (TIGR03382 family)